MNDDDAGGGNDDDNDVNATKMETFELTYRNRRISEATA